MKIYKPSVLKYVNFCKKLFIVFSCVALPLLMISLIFACMGYAAFWIIFPVGMVAYFILYGFYALGISMGTVIGFETTEQVVHVKTKRKTYTYDVKRGCKEVRESKRKFICTFETQDSRDKFVFPKKVLFAKSYEEQFTAEELSSFYPDLKNETE